MIKKRKIPKNPKSSTVYTKSSSEVFFLLFLALTAYLSNSSLHCQRWFRPLSKKTNTMTGIETKWGYPISLQKVRIWLCVSALSPRTVSKATCISGLLLPSRLTEAHNQVRYMTSARWHTNESHHHHPAFFPCVIVIILSMAEEIVISLSFLNCHFPLSFNAFYFTFQYENYRFKFPKDM